MGTKTLDVVSGIVIVLAMLSIAFMLACAGLVDANSFAHSFALFVFGIY